MLNTLGMFNYKFSLIKAKNLDVDTIEQNN